MAPTPRIGYLVTAFPVVSETFILNEVRAMESRRIPLAILALKPSPATVVHGAASRVESRCHQASWSRAAAWPRLFADHLLLCAGTRSRYWGVLAREVGRPLGSFLRRPSARARRILYKHVRRFSWAVWTARRARTLAIRHFHAHYAGEPLRVAHLVHRLTGIPYSFAAHAKDLYLAPESRLRRRLATATFAVACHGDGAAKLRRLAPAGAEGKVRLVKHGVDTDVFRPRRRRVGEHRILAVGRLTPKKGFDDLVEACARLAGKGLTFRCDILGDGRERRHLEKLIRRRGLEDRVVLHGFVPQQDLPTWLAWATVVAIPSKVLADGNRDGVPNVLVEAMASGAPVVASAVAGIPELVADGVSGLLTPPEDPRALARALRRVLEDRELARRLGQTAAAATASLDYRQTNLPLTDLLADALAHRAAAAIDAAERAAWSPGGLAARAGKGLGRRPRRDPAVEAAIRLGIRPGLEANSWRRDLSDLAGRRLWDEVVKARRLPRLLPLLTGQAEPRGRRVLDLGCGRGGLAVALDARGLATTALDLRWRNCAVARRRGERYGLDVAAVAAAGEQLPFADGSFDAVACLEVLEHVQDPVGLLREVRRVLAPGGRCVATVINRWAHRDPHYHLWGINFLPRGLASRYIALRRRTKRSSGDRQTLGDMHYYRYRDFLRLAGELGFTARDPAEPARGWRRVWHRVQRALSLGFNAATLVLETPPPAASAVARRAWSGRPRHRRAAPGAPGLRVPTLSYPESPGDRPVIPIRRSTA
ncbi:MAG: glycosyltransferase [Acidobacteriota bacterium]|nr:glycosyltransferase [Acidobacteriota bacterium]